MQSGISNFKPKQDALISLYLGLIRLNSFFYSFAKIEWMYRQKLIKLVGGSSEIMCIRALPMLETMYSFYVFRHYYTTRNYVSNG
jgi:hypothetical protein